MIIRRAEPGDAEGLTRLGEAVGSEPEGWLVTTNGWREVSDERRYLRAIRRYPNAAVFVAEAEAAEDLDRAAAELRRLERREQELEDWRARLDDRDGRLSAAQEELAEWRKRIREEELRLQAG